MRIATETQRSLRNNNFKKNVQTAFAIAIFSIFLFSADNLYGWGKKDKKKTGSPEKSAKKALIAAEKHMNKGIALREKGKNDLALAELKKAIGIDPSLAEAYLVLADIYSDLQIPEKIVECLESGVLLAENQNLDPEKLGRAYCQLAKSHLAIGKADLASGDIAKAIAQLPDDPAPKKILADIQIERGQIDAGFQAYREALKLDPANAGNWWDFGMAALHNKKLPAMQEAFLGLSKVDPVKAADFEQLMKGSKVKALKTELTNSDAKPVSVAATDPIPLPSEKTEPVKPEPASKTAATDPKTTAKPEKPHEAKTPDPATGEASATPTTTGSEPEVDDPYAIDSTEDEEE